MSKLLTSFFFLLFIVGFSVWLASKTQSDTGPILIILLLVGGCLLFAYFAYRKETTLFELEEAPETEDEKNEKEEKTEISHDRFKVQTIFFPDYTFTLAGACYRDEKTRLLLLLLPLYSEVFLEPEPTNLYDPNAIKVLLEDQVQIGYVPATKCIEVLEIIKKHPNYRCEIIRRRMGQNAPWFDIAIEYEPSNILPSKL